MSRFTRRLLSREVDVLQTHRDQLARRAAMLEAIDEGKVHSDASGTTATAGHVRADEAHLGAHDVKLAQLSGFQLDHDQDGTRGKMVRGRLRGVHVDGGSAGQADIGEVDTWGGRFAATR